MITGIHIKDGWVLKATDMVIDGLIMAGLVAAISTGLFFLLSYIAEILP